MSKIPSRRIDSYLSKRWRSRRKRGSITIVKAGIFRYVSGGLGDKDQKEGKKGSRLYEEMLRMLRGFQCNIKDVKMAKCRGKGT